MKTTNLTGLTDEELLQEAKKTKLLYYSNGVMLGVLIGIAIYSTIKNGLGFFIFLPLVFVPIANNTNKKYKDIQKELKARSLK